MSFRAQFFWANHAEIQIVSSKNSRQSEEKNTLFSIFYYICHVIANWHKTLSSQLTLKKRLCNSQTFPSPAFFTLVCALAFYLIGCVSIMLSKHNWHACVSALFNISCSLRQHCLSVHWPSDAYYTLNSSQTQDSWLYTNSKSISLPGDKVIFIRS